MGRSIYILTFHGLGSPERALLDGEERYWLASAFFEGILDRVRYRPDVFVTFDDSNSSDFAIAFPALLKRRMRASFFVVSERIGLPGFLSAYQVQELAGAGMVIGSHGATHRPWVRLRRQELDEELNASRRRLEELVGQAVDQAACPLGTYNRSVLRGLRFAGYHKVYTSDQGPARPEAWLLPRNTIRREHSLDSIRKIIESKPRAVASLLRKLKLTVKQWR
jgi:peptidoglycan/xylan/chitin deacetylase (PgdA/CDA1 family)